MVSEDDEPLIESLSYDLAREQTPHVDICVTADVRVIRYGASLLSGESDDSKVAIITTLSAVFKEPLLQNEEALSVKDSRNHLGVVVFAASHSENSIDQPLIRSSRKSTRLNASTKPKQSIADKKEQIERTVLLPYLGCTTKKTSLTITYNKRVLVKSSNSWDKITRSSEKRKPKAFRSRSLSNTPPIMKVTDSQDLELKDLFVNSLRERDMFKFHSNMVNEPLIRSFYFIKDSNSDSQVFLSDERNIKYLCRPIIDNLIDKSAYLPEKFPNKSSLKTNIIGFEREISRPICNIHAKPCRNVSILHRPRTRDKATSTTSLNKKNTMDQDLNDSIKGLLTPYISDGKAYPSELVLKLIPKKEAIESKPPKTDVKIPTNGSSEANLLAPIINTPPKKKKKKKRSIFGRCFSKSKKKKGSDDLDNSSEGSLEKEVYYPSIVEVYNKKPKKPQKEVDSDVFTTSSFDLEKKKKKSDL